MIEKVKEFNRVFEVVEVVDSKQIDLRVKLMDSELQEYKEASEIEKVEFDTTIDHFEHVLTEQFDSCLDQLYVVLGVAILHRVDVNLKKMIRGVMPCNRKDYTIIQNKELYDDISTSIALYDANAIDDNESDIKRCLGSIIIDILTLSCYHGFADKLVDGFNEVHRSNMTKLHDGKIVKNNDGKVMKPDTFEEPKLKSILWT